MWRDFSCRIWKQTEDGFQNHGQLEKAQKTWPTSPGVVLIWLLYLLYVKLISVLSAVKEVLATKSRLVGCISDLFYDTWSKKPVDTAVNWLFSMIRQLHLGSLEWNLGHWIRVQHSRQSCRYILIDSSFSLKERDVPWSWCFHMNGYGSSWKIQWLQEDMWFLGKPMFSCYVTYVSFGVCGYGPMDYMDSGRCWWRDFSMGRMNSSIWIPFKKHPNYDTIYTKDSIYRACYVSLFCWFGFQNITFICLKVFFPDGHPSMFCNV